MRFELGIDADNSAFDDEPSHEVARILRQLADKLERESSFDFAHGRVADMNGNTCGRYEWKAS